MLTWRERMRQEEERSKRLKEESAKRQEELRKEQQRKQGQERIQKRTEAEEKLWLFERLGIVPELQSINREVWGNLGEVKVGSVSLGEPCSRIATLESAFGSYSRGEKTRTERRFGFYREYHPSSGSIGYNGSSPTYDGYHTTHFGGHDKEFIDIVIKEELEWTSLSVRLSYSEKKDSYALEVTDYPWPHPQYKKVDKLEFPRARFEEKAVRDFLIRTLAASCLARTNRKLLPSDLRERAREELQRLQAKLGKRP